MENSIVYGAYIRVIHHKFVTNGVPKMTLLIWRTITAADADIVLGRNAIVHFSCY